ATGMVIAPPIVWLGAAALAAAMAGETASDLGIGAAIAVAVLLRIRAELKKRKKISAAEARRAERNAFLAEATSNFASLPVARPDPNERELSAEQVAALRFVFDRALQPIGQLAGFDHIEQFQPSALRYQLNQLGYTLALAQ